MKVPFRSSVIGTLGWISQHPDFQAELPVKKDYFQELTFGEGVLFGYFFRIWIGHVWTFSAQSHSNG